MKIFDKLASNYAALQYEKAPGVHTYHGCSCGRMKTRAGCCELCLEEERLKILDKSSTRRNENEFNKRINACWAFYADRAFEYMRTLGSAIIDNESHAVVIHCENGMFIEFKMIDSLYEDGTIEGINFIIRAIRTGSAPKTLFTLWEDKWIPTTCKFDIEARLRVLESIAVEKIKEMINEA